MKQTKISIYNHKGGVGKSVSIINLAYFLQKLQKSVLVVDCDSQRNSLDFWNNKASGVRVSVLDWDTYSENKGECDEFEYVLFDLPPLQPTNPEIVEIVSQCDTVFVPIKLGEFEISGLANVTSEIGKLGAKFGGVFVTMYKPKTDAEVLMEFQDIMGERLINTLIPDSATVGESLKCGMSVEEYLDFRRVPRLVKSSRKIALAYEALTAEILERTNA